MILININEMKNLFLICKPHYYFYNVLIHNFMECNIFLGTTINDPTNEKTL